MFEWKWVQRRNVIGCGHSLQYRRSRIYDISEEDRKNLNKITITLPVTLYSLHELLPRNAVQEEFFYNVGSDLCLSYDQKKNKDRTPIPLLSKRKSGDCMRSIQSSLSGVIFFVFFRFRCKLCPDGNRVDEGLQDSRTIRIISIQAVSYTHLDVYKRQVMRLII